MHIWLKMEKRELFDAEPQAGARSHSFDRCVLSFDIGTVNLAFCILSPDGRIIDWGVRDISATSNLVQTKKLITELRKITWGNHLVDVVIEKQPSFNPKMRVISGQVFFYYVEQMMNAENRVNHIVYYSPRKKLKIFSPQEGDLPKGTKKYKSRYAQRKYDAKEYCRIILARGTLNEKWYNEYKVKPSADLADTYLQGLSYIEEKNINM